MSVNRDELKRMIDRISEQDAIEVYDFIGYLNMKSEKEELSIFNIDSLSKDRGLIQQVQKSREDRHNGLIYSKEEGLKYLRNKVEEFEREQNV